MLDEYGVSTWSQTVRNTVDKIVRGRLNKVSAVLLLIIFILARLHNISLNNQTTICNRTDFDQRQQVFVGTNIMPQFENDPYNCA